MGNGGWGEEGGVTSITALTAMFVLSRVDSVTKSKG